MSGIPPSPHPRNVSGDFYVEDGCCLTCSAVFDVAPGHFEYTEDELSCFVKKQPNGDAETANMINAVWASEASCVRYRGNNTSVLNELVKKGEEKQCDALVYGDTQEQRLGFKESSIRLFGKLRQRIHKK